MEKLVLPLAAKRDHTAMKIQESQLLENISKNFNLQNDQDGELIIKRLKDLQYQVHLDIKHIIELEPTKKIMSEAELEEIRIMQERMDALNQIKVKKQMIFIQAYEQINKKKRELDMALGEEIKQMVDTNYGEVSKIMEQSIGEHLCINEGQNETTVSDQFEEFYEEICKSFVEQDMRNEHEIQDFQRQIQLKMNENKQLKEKLVKLRTCQKFLKSSTQ